MYLASGRREKSGMATSKIASGSSVFSIPESSSSKSNIFQNGSARSFSMISSSSKNLNSLNHLHTMDPDEIFAKHTVHEVKSMLFRLRQVAVVKEVAHAALTASKP